MLYFLCRGLPYFGGFIGAGSRHETRNGGSRNARRRRSGDATVGLLGDTLCQGTANGRRETLDPLARDRLRDEKRF